MNDGLIHDLSYMVDRKSAEEYFRSLAIGKTNVSQPTSAVAYAYKAMTPLIDYAGISKKQFYSSEQEDYRKKVVNAFASFARKVKRNAAQVRQVYPELINRDGTLNMSAISKECNSFFDDFTTVKRNMKDGKGDIDFLEKNYGEMIKNNFFGIFLGGSEMRQHLLAISSDKNYGIDLEIYDAVRRHLAISGVTFEDYMENADLRSHYRNLLRKIKDEKNKSRPEGMEISDEEACFTMSVNVTKWGDFRRKVGECKSSPLATVTFDDYISMSERERSSLDNKALNDALYSSLMMPEDDYTRALEEKVNEKANSYVSSTFADFQAMFGSMEDGTEEKRDTTQK